MVVFDLDREVHDLEEIDEIHGSLSSQWQEDKLMHSVMEGDKRTIEDGKLIAESINRGLGSLTPDLMLKNLVTNYGSAKQLYGERLLRLVTGYEPSSLERNVRVPEFQKELRAALTKNIERLKDEEFLDKEGNVADRGLSLAALVMYTEELDNLMPHGIVGQRQRKERGPYGEHDELRPWRKGDKYRDLALRQTIRVALKHGRSAVVGEDLRAAPRTASGSVSVVLGLDASGSMRGNKIEMAKKAGIALAFRAVERKDNVGLIVFGKDVRESVAPMQHFGELLRRIAGVRAAAQTNFVGMIRKAIELFHGTRGTKHLVLLTDALPTVGEAPEKDTLQAVSEAMASGITLSIIGIQLTDEGKVLAEKMVRIGDGRLYVARQLGELDQLVLEDYEALRE